MAEIDFDELVNRVGADGARRIIEHIAPLLERFHGDLQSGIARITKLELLMTRSTADIIAEVQGATSVQRSVLNLLKGMEQRDADQRAALEALKAKAPVDMHPEFDAALNDLDASTAELRDKAATIAAATVTNTAASATESPGVVQDPPPTPPADPVAEAGPKPSDAPAQTDTGPADTTPQTDGDATTQG